jgi:predicted RNase H-like HicB family nuclease
MTCVIEKTETGFSARLLDGPACVATGATLEEVVRIVREALCLHFQANPENIPLTFRSGTKWCSIESAFPVAAV